MFISKADLGQNLGGRGDTVAKDLPLIQSTHFTVTVLHVGPSRPIAPTYMNVFKIVYSRNCFGFESN